MSIDWARFFGAAAATVSDLATLKWRSTEQPGERIDAAWQRIYGEPMPSPLRQLRIDGDRVWVMSFRRVVVERADGVVELRALDRREGVFERMIDRGASSDEGRAMIAEGRELFDGMLGDAADAMRRRLLKAKDPKD